MILLWIFLRLQNAFDTIDHETLFVKLEHYGFRGNTLNIIKSFLSNRRIHCYANNCKSEEFLVNCGLPQGTVLSPLIFLLYINDIKNALYSEKIRLFADDSNVFIVASNLSELFIKANNTLVELDTYFRANKLSLNIDKTNYMLFKPNSDDLEYITNNNLTVKINNSVIARTQAVKYLGVNITQDLKWNTHIDELRKHINSYAGIMYKYRDNFSPYTAKNIFLIIFFPEAL